ncbi:uncharacterized protein LOC111394471 [Olea europaea var. sylvestris]|uniref:Bifunctional inhibitor/plant lipid transfer protein/seed storage helical domain-containing protein n=1 Tax=Olea europaea subsp. europaea TaxID=158383 RepID=A0A8S0TIF4_OLEEU|nr:uncharacterized protein LOC111394471 [Olea europaea var. sylvestris]CAA3005360.1 Hypothetical predicted protein [Olea europaea subsp. europaea]
MYGKWVGMLILVTMVGGGWVVPMAHGVTPSECKDEKNTLVNNCRPVIFGSNPSAACCQNVRDAHIECVCPYLGPKAAATIRTIGVSRVVQLIEGCGRSVPRNYKCGSITTPP